MNSTYLKDYEKGTSASFGQLAASSHRGTWHSEVSCTVPCISHDGCCFHSWVIKLSWNKLSFTKILSDIMEGCVIVTFAEKGRES